MSSTAACYLCESPVDPRAVMLCQRYKVHVCDDCVEYYVKGREKLAPKGIYDPCWDCQQRRPLWDGYCVPCWRAHRRKCEAQQAGDEGAQGNGEDWNWDGEKHGGV
eukprot:Sspe_Gene.86593::Locus_57296_Transcript_1_1_Confidence_1.000_Length_373::g.86593::m.86593